VVCAWIGNSAAIAAKHYLQVTDADFKRAARSGAAARQKAVQQPAAKTRKTQPKGKGLASLCEVVRLGHLLAI
jgi:hypothetical protein